MWLLWPVPPFGRRNGQHLGGFRSHKSLIGHELKGDSQPLQSSPWAAVVHRRQNCIPITESNRVGGMASCPKGPEGALLHYDHAYINVIP